MAEFSGTILKALSSQSTLLGQGEHCSLDPQRVKSIGLVTGTQVRVRRSSSQFALYTISETQTEAGDIAGRMALAARLRLGTSDEFSAVVSTKVPNSTLSDSEAEKRSEFVERLDDDGRQKGLVVLAPHGGMIEKHTDSQAQRVSDALRSRFVSVWLCKGWKSGGGASERWHITSTDIHQASFPLLNTIVRRRFMYAVSFHGFSEADVLIGGSAPLKLKREIEAALKTVLRRSGIPVRIATPSENYSGDSPKNIVNRITARGANGVQIEQSAEARNDFWQPIADAVASVYRRRLARMR